MPFTAARFSYDTWQNGFNSDDEPDMVTSWRNVEYIQIYNKEEIDELLIDQKTAFDTKQADLQKEIRDLQKKQETQGIQISGLVDSIDHIPSAIEKLLVEIVLVESKKQLQNSIESIKIELREYVEQVFTERFGDDFENRREVVV